MATSYKVKSTDVVMTNSGRECFQTCHRKYWWKYVRGLEPRGIQDNLEIGKMFHAGIAKMLQGASLEEALNTLVIDQDNADLADCILMARFLLERYHAQNKPVMKWPELLAVEFPFSFRIGEIDGNTVWCAGVIDAMVRDSSKQAWVVEHKTAGIIDSEYLEKVSLDQQITTYLAAAKLILGGEAIAGVIYNVCGKPRIYRRQGESTELYLTRAEAEYVAKPNVYFGEQPAYRNESDTVVMMREMLEVSREVIHCRKSDFWPKSTGQCFMRNRRCPFVELCRDGENLHTIGAYERREPFPELREAGLNMSELVDLADSKSS